MEKEIYIPVNEFNRSDYRFFVIVADIGGSNAYFAVMGVKNEKNFDIILKNTWPSNEIKALHEILNNLLSEAKKDYGVEINRCCIGAAGPVSRKRGYIKFTNLDLEISAKKILDNTMLNKVIMVNDFEAIGYSLDLLNLEKDNIQLKHLEEDLTAGCVPWNTSAVIGAGAGLGMCIVPYNHSIHMHTPLPSEGGHIDFSPRDDFELELMEFLKRKALENKDAQPEFERLLSGKGMQHIYDFLRSRNSCEETDITRRINSLKGNQKLHEIDINYDNDATCKKTIDLFINFYARAARTLALMSECYSGLFITGRIALLHLDRFQHDSFMEEFVLHDKRSDVLKKIPVYIITNRDTSLYGCCNVAVNFYNLK